jgi:processive 1,2-diacylglycerol beta-glucosyltransferase
MIIWEPIPGQELFNTAHLLEQGAAAAPDAAVTLGYTVDQLLNNPDRMASMKTAARNTGCPHAARDIINTLVQCHQEPVIKVRKRLV